MSVITLNDGEAVFDCAEGDTLLRAGLRAGLALPYECGVGACGCCRCEVTAGATWTLADRSELSVVVARALGEEVKGTGPSTGVDVRMSQNWLGAAYAWKW